MLPDRERKLLRILINYPSPVHKSRMPDYRRLEMMTGRSYQDLLKGLRYLEDHGYIIWPNKSTTENIQIIKAEVMEQSPPSKQRNMDYWTKY